MKPQLSFTFLLLLFSSSIFAQVEFKVKLLTDNTTYQVLFKSNSTYNAPFNATSSGQVTMRAPSGGFSVGSVNGILGTWSLDQTVVEPAESPDFDYFIFGLQGATNDITYTEGEEIVVFEFVNSGNCTGAIELIDNDTDPFGTNSMNIGIDNTLAVIGAGIGQNAYAGNYGAISADCTPSSSCGVEVFDIILTAPSACGVADGSIEIVATNSGGLPLQYRINDTGPGSAYQSDPIFTGLSAGEEFEITVRDIAAICSVEAGTFELPGPLAAIPNGADLVNPDCGMMNGSITLDAIPQIPGNTLNYGIGTPPVYQASSTFNNLAEGTYSFWVIDIDNNCENFFGNYVLSGCAEPDCPLTYDLEYIGNGRYQVNLTTDTTWNFPLNFTSAMDVAFKVPTGGFEVDNIESQISGLSWAYGSEYIAPAEAPGFDYFKIGMDDASTDQIPYIQGNTITLFTFDNIGSCEGANIFLMAEDDPFTANPTNNLGQYAFVAGGMDIVPCLGDDSAICEMVPESCLITYELEKTGPNTFQVSMIPDVTWQGAMALTSGFQVSIRVPAGDFQVADLNSLVTDVNWGVSSTYEEPVESPGYDYITISVSNLPTSNIPYDTGVKTPLFTFSNGGTCQDANIELIDNDTDPFAPSNQNPGTNANVGQQLFTVGSASDVEPCILNNEANDCNEDPCAGLTTSFTAADACLGENTSFTSTTTSTEAITSWEWNFGDTPAGTSSDENPTYSYSNPGNFEVSLTVTTESGCMASFSDFVTVFSIPDIPTVTEYIDCNGSGVQLSVPATDMISWSPTTGLDDPASATPFANPATTTTYTVTMTNADGCVSTADVTVNVSDKPVFDQVNITQASDCGVQDASIEINATGTGNILYSIDGTNYGTDNVFNNLAPGDYTVFIQNESDGCVVAFNGNPVTIENLQAPSIDDVAVVNPTGCNPDGSITVTASGGTGILMYELTGLMNQGPQASNVFNNLMEGDYTVTVTNENGSCAQTQDVSLVGQGNNLTIQTPVADQDLCVSATANISITLNEDIASFNITGGSFANEDATGNTLTFEASANMGANDFTVNFTSVSGCAVAESFTLTGVAEAAPDFGTTSSLCANGNITFNYSGSGDGQITWDIADGAVVNGDLNSSPVVISFATAGQKQICVTMDDDGCQVQDCQMFTITAFDPQASFDTSDPDCGQNNGTIDLTTNGNYTYQWAIGQGIIAQNIGNEDQTGLIGGVYTVEISDGSGCSVQEQVTLDISTSITVVLNADDAADCSGTNGSGSITAQVVGGTGDIVYELMQGTDIIDTESTTATSFTFEDLAPGVYTVQATLNGSCNDSETIAVQSNSSTLSATSSHDDAECGLSNGTFSIAIHDGAAPYTYDLYYNNIPQGSNLNLNGTLNIGNIPANTEVQAIIYDANGCILPIFELVGEEPVNLTSLTSTEVQPSCGGFDGCITLDGLPNGSIVTWEDKSNPGFSIGIGNELCGVGTGVYCAQILTQSGCIELQEYSLTAGDVEIVIDSQSPADCGENNGSVTFIVNGINDFEFEIFGVTPSNFGQGGVPITITGLDAGVDIIEVYDLSGTGCEAFELIETAGEIASNVQVTTIPVSATECGIANGYIQVQLNGNSNTAYTLEADQGNVPGGAFLDSVFVGGLYSGPVNLTLTEAGTECTIEIEVPLVTPEEPDVMANLLGVQSFSCPDEMGSIIASSGEMEVFDMDMNSIGMTPLLDLPAGTYNVQQTIGICTETEVVEITGPEAFFVQELIAVESCDGLDGGIDILVSGGTPNTGPGPEYTFEWSNGSTNEDLLFVSSGDYSLTITDAVGCTHEMSFFIDVEEGCTNPCEDIFLVDTFLVELVGDQNKICLPTEYADLNIFNLSLNNEEYIQELGACTEFTNFYGYGLLLTLGAPPYNLVEWTYRDIKAPEFAFETMEELVGYLNLLDTYGNWGLNMSSSSINGGEPTSEYGSLVISHIASGTTLTLQVNTVSVDRPSITVDDSPFHTFIATDPTNSDCADTLYINLSAQAPDTIYVEVPVGDTEFPCLPTAGLVGSPESLTNLCESLNGNSQLVSTGDVCVAFQGMTVGQDIYCMEICDDLGNCIVVNVVVNVTDDDEFTIYNGFSPNDDNVNDYFRIKGIDRFPNNKLAIFNRWGSRVYYKESYSNLDPWKAIYRNTHLPDGSYFYYLEVEMNGKNETFTGLVEVKR